MLRRLEFRYLIALFSRILWNYLRFLIRSGILRTSFDYLLFILIFWVSFVFYVLIYIFFCVHGINAE